MLITNIFEKINNIKIINNQGRSFINFYILSWSKTFGFSYKYYCVSVLNFKLVIAIDLAYLINFSGSKYSAFGFYKTSFFYFSGIISLVLSLKN